MKASAGIARILRRSSADRGGAIEALITSSYRVATAGAQQGHCGLREPVGLRDERAEDQSLSARLLDRMQANRIDYTNLFRDLAGLLRNDTVGDASLRNRFADGAGFDAWVGDYRERLRAERSDDAWRRKAMQAVNPGYVVRNYLVQQAIEQAEQGDYGEIDRLLTLLSQPFSDQPGMQAYASEPPDWRRHLEVSCSS